MGIPRRLCDLMTAPTQCRLLSNPHLAFLVAAHTSQSSNIALKDHNMAQVKTNVVGPHEAKIPPSRCIAK